MFLGVRKSGGVREGIGKSDDSRTTAAETTSWEVA